MPRELSYAQAINEAQRQAMELCEDVVVLGQLAWDRDVLHDPPLFTPPAERKTRFIAVVASGLLAASWRARVARRASSAAPSGCSSA